MGQQASRDPIIKSPCRAEDDLLKHHGLTTKDADVPPLEEGVLGAVNDAGHLGLARLGDTSEEALGARVVHVDPFLHSSARGPLAANEVRCGTCARAEISSWLGLRPYPGKGATQGGES